MANPSADLAVKWLVTKGFLCAPSPVDRWVSRKQQADVSPTYIQTGMVTVLKLSCSQPKLDAVIAIEAGQVRRALVAAPKKTGDVIGLYHVDLDWQDPRRIPAEIVWQTVESFLDVGKIGPSKDDIKIAQSFLRRLVTDLRKAAKEYNGAEWSPEEAMEIVSSVMNQSNPDTPKLQELVKTVLCQLQFHIELNAR